MPLVCFAQPCQFRAAALAALSEAGVEAEVRLTSTSHAALRAAAAEGVVVTILAVPDVKEELDLSRLLPPLPAMRYEVLTAEGAEPATEALRLLLEMRIRGGWSLTAA